MTSPPLKPPRPVWDVVLSIIFLVFALFTALVAVVSQGFIFAFTDYCPPATCHIEQGVNSVLIVWGIMAVILVAGVVLTIVSLVKRRRAWWVALSALVAIVVGAIVAFALYVTAVG